MTKAKSKKAAPDICSEISNKISTKGAFSVVKTIRQNILEAFPLPSNYDKLPLVTTKATFSSLAGFSSVKVSSKRYTWVSPNVAFTLTKSPKVFNNRPVNKLVFPFIDSTPGPFRQLLASAIVTPNPFVIPNEILNEIFIALSGMLFKMGQDQPLVVLPNVVSSGRLLPVLEAKQSSPVGSPVFGNWADQIETESSLSLVFGAISGVTSTLVPGATFKIKLAHVKTVFQSVHGFLDAKSVSKDNVKLFCVEFASQVSLEAAFLVEFISSVYLATLKIAKSLVVLESGFFSAAVALCNVLLGVSAANIKTVLSVFGIITCVVLKLVGIWQYVSVLVGKDSVRILFLVNQNKTILSHDRFKAKLVNFSSGCTVFEISDMISQVGGQTCFIPWFPNSGRHLCFTLVTFGSQADLDFAITKTGHLAVDCKVASFPFFKTSKVFKLRFVGSLSYVKAFTPPVMSEFPPLVTFAPSVAIVDPVVGSRLDSLEKQISDLAALVKSIVEPIGSLVVLVSHLFDDNTVKAVQIEKNLFSMKYASNNFANLLVGVSKDIACLRSEFDFGGMDYNDMQAAKSSLLSEDTIEHVIALWWMLGVEVKNSVESTRLFLSEFIFNSRNLNGVIEKICGLGLFPPSIVSA
ncbi:hypothetical protein G9A89_021007 [Geosiphon pyriformis]|nr:hypothetical protein G9A89_021007 [Geosiphon pyriformis]